MSVKADQWFPGKEIHGIAQFDHGRAAWEGLNGYVKVSPGDWVISCFGEWGERVVCIMTLCNPEKAESCARCGESIVSSKLLIPEKHD